LWFNLVLDHQGLALVVNLLRELGGDGVMGSGVLHDQTLVAIDTLQDSRLFHGPFTNVGPFVLRLGIILLRGRRLPTRLPVIGELLQERSLEGSGLTKD
jgi:hypothetical protein